MPFLFYPFRKQRNVNSSLQKHPSLQDQGNMVQEDGEYADDMTQLKDLSLIDTEKKIEAAADEEYADFFGE